MHTQLNEHSLLNNLIQIWLEMKVSKVRKILVSSIVVPISVTNSDAFKKRNKNLKANDKVVNTSIIWSKLGYIINSKEIWMKNDIFVNNLKTNEDLLDALNEKQVISEAKQIDKWNKKVNNHNRYFLISKY